MKEYQFSLDGLRLIEFDFRTFDLLCRDKKKTRHREVSEDYFLVGNLLFRSLLHSKGGKISVPSIFFKKLFFSNNCLHLASQ